MPRGSCLKEYPSLMCRPPVKTWMDNLWRQHIIYIPAAVHSIDGEKRWSPVSINAAPLSRNGRWGRGALRREEFENTLKTFSFPFRRFANTCLKWKFNCQCGMIENRLSVKKQLSLLELLGFHKTSSIDESTLWSIDSRGGITLHYIHNPIWLWFVRCSMRFDGNNCL